MKATERRYVDLELTQQEVNGLHHALANTLAVVKTGIPGTVGGVSISVPSVDIERLERLYDVLDDVRD